MVGFMIVKMNTFLCLYTKASKLRNPPVWNPPVWMESTSLDGIHQFGWNPPVWMESTSFLSVVGNSLL